MKQSEARLKQFADNLKRTDAQQRADGGLGGLAKVALPIAAIAAAARFLKDGAAAAKELSAEFRDGAISKAEWVSGIAAGLPIMRELHSAALDIWAVFEPIKDNLTSQIAAQTALGARLKDQVALAGAANDNERKRLAILAEHEKTLTEIARLERERAGADGSEAATAKAAADQQRKLAETLRDRKLAEADNTSTVRQSLRALEEQTRLLGQSASFVELDRIQRAGATIEQLGYAEALIKQRDAQQAALDAAKEAAEADKRRQEGIEATLRSLREQRDLLGLSTADQIAYRLANEGATDAQIAQAMALQTQIDGMKKWESAQERAKTLIEETQTPLEAYHTELAELRDLHSAGLIDDQTLRRAGAKALAGIGRVEFSSAGTFQRDLSGFGGQTRGRNLDAEQLTALEKIEAATGRTADAVNRLSDKLTVS